MIGWTFFIGALLVLFGGDYVAGFVGVGLILVALGCEIYTCRTNQVSMRKGNGS